MRPPGERVEIPYQGKTLAGILRKPHGVERPPVVVMAVGLDSTKEETDAYEAPFLARGMATLVFEGPGQGEAQYDFAIRGDYEVPAEAVLDYIETRRDLDAARIGLWGVSLGGYYAPRAAAFDKRIKACMRARRAVRLGRGLGRPAGPDARGVPRAQPLQDAMKTRARTRRRCRSKAWRSASPARCSSSTAGSTASCRPRTPSAWRARCKGPVELMMIEDGNHIATNRAYRWRSPSADWMSRSSGSNSEEATRDRRAAASMPLSLITSISPVCTPALRSSVTTFGCTTTTCPARNGSSRNGPGRPALAAENRRQIAAAVAVQQVVDDGEAGLLDHAGGLDHLGRRGAGLEHGGDGVEGHVRRRVQVAVKRRRRFTDRKTTAAPAPG